MAQIKIRANIPNQTDATAMYRSSGPIGHMARKYSEFDFYIDPTYNWATLMRDDVIFLQRPYRPDHIGIVKMAKACGKKIWVDYDDDLLSVPVSNPTYKIYGKDETKRAVAQIVAMSDLVTVSTPHLKRVFEKGPKPLNKNIVVIPNAYNTHLLSHIRPKQAPNRQKLIVWRGSATHHKDLAEYADEIVDIVNSHKDWTFLFQGDKPWFLFERLNDNAIFSDPLDPIEYFQMLVDLAPMAMIVPLYDCEFNKSKSNIAWIEAAFAGAAAISPDWEEWRHPGALLYKNRAGFRDRLEEVLSAKVDCGLLAGQSWDYIQENLDIGVVNEKRREAILSLGA